MTTISDPNQEHEFQDRLLAAVNEAREHTRRGVTTILKDIQSIGGLQAAKKRLRTRSHTPPHQFVDEFFFFNQPSKYFLATERVGRMDLSIEAIALEPNWQGLFTPEEIDEAAATLSEHGFDPGLEPPTAPDMSALVPIEQEPSLARTLLGEHRGGLDLDFLAFFNSACEVTAKSASALREGRPLSARPVVRKHLSLGECPNCRDLYPELVAAYDQFDQEVLGGWVKLVKIFQASMDLGDAKLKRFMLTGPDDYEDPEDYAATLDRELEESIGPICAWRAVRLGCHVGRFMSAFASTFPERGDLWVKWRKGEICGWVPASVRAIDRQLFITGLLARNLLLVRSWPKEDEGVLWVPTDGDLDSVPGFVRTEVTSDMEEWEEVLGEPPKDLNLLGILYLAHVAAVAEVEEFEAGPNEPGAVQAARDRSNRKEEMFHAIMNAHNESREREDVLIAQVERVVERMTSSDLYTCEAALEEELADVYSRLKPEARSQLLAAEQIYRTQGFAAPGMIVHAIATAFEIQMRQSVLPELFAYLKFKNVRKLPPLPEWKDADRRTVWETGMKADNYTLGEMLWVLRHTHPAICEFFALAGLDRLGVLKALEEVRARRNVPAHGRPLDPGTTKAIRADWFHWGSRPGGIFAVFFRNE
jgi:hypothetical protein